MFKGHKISVVVPVYNEGKTVAGVIESLLLAKKVDQVICVDDGSTDETYQVLKNFKPRISLIHYTKNKGKGFALSKGVKIAKGDIVIFCDSDLVNLSESDITKLIEPLLRGEVRMVMGHPKGKPVMGLYAKTLAGERAFFKKDLLPILSNFKTKGFAIETYLNHVFKKWETVNLEAYHLEKFEKMKSDEAFLSYLQEIIEITKENAKLKGFWNKEFEVALRSLTKAKTLRQLILEIERVRNKRLKTILKKYFLKYYQRIASLIS